MSECYERSISDKRLVEVSRLLKKLEPCDEVMADKGFQIQDLLASLGVQLNILPFLNLNHQMPDDVILTKNVNYRTRTFSLLTLLGSFILLHRG